MTFFSCFVYVQTQSSFQYNLLSLASRSVCASVRRGRRSLVSQWATIVDVENAEISQIELTELAECSVLTSVEYC